MHPNEIIRKVNQVGLCCYFLGTVTAHVEESWLPTKSPEHSNDTEKWFHRHRLHFPASIAGRWEHMTKPYGIATSMRNNCSCAELANFCVFNYYSCYSEPNNRPQNITVPINSFLKLHTQTLFGCSEQVIWIACHSRVAILLWRTAYATGFATQLFHHQWFWWLFCWW